MLKIDEKKHRNTGFDALWQGIFPDTLSDKLGTNPQLS